MAPSEQISNLRGLHVAVVGDMMLDHYIWGDTRRISPEAPVPVIEVLRESHTAGGAANVALNLASLGVQVSLCGAYGSDAAGFKLAGLLQEKGAALSAEHASPDRRTIVKTRVMVQRQQLCRIDVEDGPASYGLEHPKSMEAVLAAVTEARAVILSDYAKGALTQSLVDTVAGIAVRAGTVLAWDPKPRNPIIPRGVTVLTPNRLEAHQLAGLADPRPGDPFPALEIGRMLFERYQPRYLVVTLGADGMMLYEGPGQGVHLPTMAREVFDVSGAGDTVVAVLAAGLAAGWSAVDAAIAANAAAGVVVGKVGTAAITSEEMAASLGAAGGWPESSVRIPA